MYVNNRSHLTVELRVLEITIEYYEVYYFTYWTDDGC